jgi:hypothetical protein
MKFFNVAGPCNPQQHYMINAVERIKGVDLLIEQGQYFGIHAARQSGKTTFLLEMMKKLNAEGNYYALYCSLEGLQGISDPEIGIPEIVKKIKYTLTDYDFPNSSDFAKDADYQYFTGILNIELKKMCKRLDKPLVIFFDEADCLSYGTLISFLRQLRDGYVNRSVTPFVHSIALVGMRNIRDFKAQVRPDNDTLGSASPFNIATKSYTLTNFTKEEIVELYDQHSLQTGQIFEKEAIDYIFEQTCGQPWLVNAVAREVIVEMLGNDFSKPVTAEMTETAIQTIIKRRDTHIDSLLERLKEDRVRSIIQPLIIGEEFFDRQSDNFLYVRDLGLIKEENRAIVPANPIYAEIIIRTLSYDFQQEIKQAYSIPKYYQNNRIDVNLLLADFQQFWRENSDIWKEKTQYREAAPHLILQAFLQRVINGGGDIIREMAVGSGRLDLCVVYKGKKYPIEIKLWRGDQYYQRGLEQAAQYAGTLGCKAAWIVSFNQNATAIWEEKIFHKQEIVDGVAINVFGC